MLRRLYRAQFLLARNRMEEAELAWREAVSVAVLLHGAEGEQSLVVRNSLATVMSMRGKHKEAANMLEEVVRAAKVSNTPHLSSYLVNLGLVRLKLGLVEAAKRDCKEAAGLAADLMDPEVISESSRCLEAVMEQLENRTK